MSSIGSARPLRKNLPVGVMGDDGTLRALANNGNTCYQNSVMQVFMRLPEVRNFLQRMHNSEHQADKPDCHACALNNAYAAYFPTNSALDKDQTRLQIEEANSHLYKITWRKGQFLRGDPDPYNENGTQMRHQQDAEEYLRHVVDYVRDDLAAATDQSVSQNQRFQETSGSLAKGWESLLYMTMIRRRKCHNPSCGAMRRAPVEQNMLSVDLKSNSTLQELVDTALSIDHVDHQCTECNQPSHSNESMSIKDVPEYVCLTTDLFVPWIHPNGSYGERRNTETIVWDDETTVDLGPHLYEHSVVEGPVRYRIAGVILHRGETKNAGHYVALTTQDQNTWYLCNDERVQKLSFAGFCQTKVGKRFRPYVFILARDTEFPQDLQAVQSTSAVSPVSMASTPRWTGPEKRDHSKDNTPQPTSRRSTPSSEKRGPSKDDIRRLARKMSSHEFATLSSYVYKQALDQVSTQMYKGRAATEELKKLTEHHAQENAKAKDTLQKAIHGLLKTEHELRETKDELRKSKDELEGVQEGLGKCEMHRYNLEVKCKQYEKELESHREKIDYLECRSDQLQDRLEHYDDLLDQAEMDVQLLTQERDAAVQRVRAFGTPDSESPAPPSSRSKKSSTPPKSNTSEKSSRKSISSVSSEAAAEEDAEPDQEEPQPSSSPRKAPTKRKHGNNSDDVETPNKKKAKPARTADPAYKPSTAEPDADESASPTPSKTSAAKTPPKSAKTSKPAKTTLEATYQPAQAESEEEDSPPPTPSKTPAKPTMAAKKNPSPPQQPTAKKTAAKKTSGKKTPPKKVSGGGPKKATPPNKSPSPAPSPRRLRSGKIRR